MTTYNAHPISTAAMLRALAQALAVLTVYTIQRTAHALRMACRLGRIVRHWLNTSHTFAEDEGERCTLTGWQFVGFSLVASAFALVLSIEF